MPVKQRNLLRSEGCVRVTLSKVIHPLLPLTSCVGVGLLCTLFHVPLLARLQMVTKYLPCGVLTGIK